MLSSAHRLRRPADFRRTVRRGVRVARPTVVVHVSTDECADGVPQVGFVVSKAVGNAVERNRVKRRLREIVRPVLTGAGGCDVGLSSCAVVRALPAAAAATFVELERDVTSALGSASGRAMSARAR